MAFPVIVTAHGRGKRHLHKYRRKPNFDLAGAHMRDGLLTDHRPHGISTERMHYASHFP